MDIYLSMLKERLEKQGFPIEGTIGQDAVVEHIRLGAVSPAGQTLHVYSDTPGRVSLSCGQDVLVMENIPLDDAFNTTMATWEYYHRWGDALAGAAAAGATLQELVDIATPMLGNPIFIANWQGEVFAFSREYALADRPIREERAFWQSIVTNGKLPITTVQRLRKSPNRDVVLRGQGASILNFKDYDYTCIIGTLSSLNEIHLYLQVMQSETTLTQVSCKLADYLLEVITRIPLTDLSKSLTSLVNLFCDLLEQKEVAESDLDWVLATLGWEKQEELLLASFQNAEGPLIAEAFCGQLERCLPEAVTFLWNGQAIAILKHSDFDVAREAIERSAKELGFVGGISVPFDDMENLSAYYSQTEIALRYRSEGQILTFCHDHAWPYLTDKLQGMAAAAKLCHPAIAVLQAYDEKNETKLLDTLYAYLMCERNAVMASDKLFIHRNTLQYRLHRINELISADLNDPDVRSHLMLSYRCCPTV